MRVGDKVVYPGHGPCLLASVVERCIDGKSVSFYQMSVLYDQTVDLFIPVDKIDGIGLRFLVSKGEIASVLEMLTKAPIVADNWKLRALDNKRLFSSGSAFDLATVIKSLTDSSNRKDLSIAEGRLLARARQLLIGEICEVTGDPGASVEQEIDKALSSRDEERV